MLYILENWCLIGYFVIIMVLNNKSLIVCFLLDVVRLDEDFLWVVSLCLVFLGGEGLVREGSFLGFIYYGGWYGFRGDGGSGWYEFFFFWGSVINLLVRGGVIREK